MRIPSRKKVNLDKVMDALSVIAIFGIMVAGFWIGYASACRPGATS